MKTAEGADQKLLSAALAGDNDYRRAHKTMLWVFVVSMIAFALGIFHWQNMGGHYMPATMIFIVGLSLTIHLSNKMSVARDRVEAGLTKSAEAPRKSSPIKRVRRKKR